MNLTFICTVFKMQSWNFTGTSVPLRDRSWKRWRFYHSPIGVRNKGLITQKTWIRRAFAQFLRWRVETPQERRWLTVTRRGGVDDSTYPQRGQKWRVNHSKNVNATCIRTVFRIKSWNFTGTSTTSRERSWMGWRFYRFPMGVRNKGLITQKT